MRWFLLLSCIFAFVVPFECIGREITPRECVALILARGGSKQVPKKNLAVIQNVSLLKRVVHIAISAQVFSDVWVSTDDQEIYEESRAAGANVFARSEETANDTASSLDAVLEFHAFFPNVSCIALLQCTSPFQSALYLRQAYFTMMKFRYDSVFSVVRSHKLLWRKHADGSVMPVNFNPKARPRRQDLKPQYIENGMFYLFRTKLLKYGYIQGGKIGVVEIPSERSIEIDTYEDLEYARHISTALFPIISRENCICWSEEGY